MKNKTEKTNEMFSSNLLLCIDANSLIHRAYHAYPPSLRTDSGIQVNAVYGFTSMLLDVILKFKPEFVICAMDTKRKTFRNDIYSEYKATRKALDSELLSQFPLVEEVVKTLNIPLLKVEGYEADDILGTIAKLVQEDTKMSKEVEKCLIFTGDRDLYQLVNGRTNLIMPKGSFKNLQIINSRFIRENVGIEPSHIVHFKALMGDNSDNIPGVKGIGPKTAMELIKEYQDLERIYSSIEIIKSSNSRVGKLLEESKDKAFMSLELSRIFLDVPIKLDILDARLKDFKYKKVLELFLKFQFKSLLGKLKKLDELFHAGSGLLKEENSLFDKSKSEQLQFSSDYSLNLDTELKKLFIRFLKLSKKQETVDISIGSLEKQTLSKIDELEKSYLCKEIELTEFLEISYLRQEFKLPNEVDNLQKLIYYDHEFKKLRIYELSGANINLCSVARVHYIWCNWFNFWLDAFAVGGGYGKILEIANRLNFYSNTVDINSLAYSLSTGLKGYDTSSVIFENIKIYKEDLSSTTEVELLKLLLSVALKQLLNFSDDKKLLEFHQSSDLKAIIGVAMIHNNGINLDLTEVRKFDKELSEIIAKTEKEILEEVGFEFNVRSTQQLSKILFEHLKLPKQKRTKTGQSTDDSTLRKLRNLHPVIELILKYREIYKLSSTYVKPFLSYSSNNEGCPTLLKEKVRIHSDFNPYGTSTGRLSSSNPNLQNLPIKTDYGKNIRRFFTAEEDNVLLSLDYSQIDLRVMADVSKDENLIQDFIDGKDIHRATASKIFKKEYTEVSDKERSIAKTVNFGIIYGISPFGLSKSLGVSYKEARIFINEYFGAYPKVKDYMDRIERHVRKTGLVVSPAGRVRRIWEVNSKNRVISNSAIREAINMPIQAGSDEIMRLALAQIVDNDEILKGKVKIVLQIHDEFVFEVPDTDYFKNDWAMEIKNLMENVRELSVPLKVEYVIGKSLAM